jgi:hypothetical protein
VDSQLEKAAKGSGIAFGLGLLLVVVVLLFVASASIFVHAVSDVAQQVDQSGGLKHIVDRVWNGAQGVAQ